jgi:hypothetical protein
VETTGGCSGSNFLSGEVTLPLSTQYDHLRKRRSCNRVPARLFHGSVAHKKSPSFR